MQQLIDVTKLSCNINETKILSEVSLQVFEGQFVGIIGPNGSGKTTLLNCLSGFYQKVSGTITLHGNNLGSYSTKSLAREIAYLHQETPDDLNLNVRQVVELGLLPRLPLFSAMQSQHQHDINNAINAVGLSNKTTSAFDELSGGEKQRCLLAKVMVQKPRILLMDEPTNHLDIHYQIEILSMVKRLGITVIASFHDLNLAANYCDYLICLNDGRIDFQGTPDAVLNVSRLQRIFKVPVVVDTNPLNHKQRISFNLDSEQNEIS